MQPSTASLRQAPGVLRRHALLYAALWKNSVAREMGFKTSFLLWILVESFWFILQLSFMGVMFLHTKEIAGWTQWQVVMLVGASQLIQQTFQAFFLNNCTQLSELVHTGRMDFMLLLPANTRFLVSLRQVDLGGFVNALLGLAVMIYAGHRMGLEPSLGQVVGFCVLVCVGIAIHYSLMFALATVSFWTVKAQGIIWGYYNLFNIARMPESAFQGTFRIVFKFVLPVLLVSNVPVKLLTDKLTDPWEWVLLVGMGVGCFAFSEWIWRRSIRRYSSASS